MSKRTSDLLILALLMFILIAVIVIVSHIVPDMTGGIRDALYK